MITLPNRAVIYAETDGGETLPAPSDVNGHPEVVIHGPRNPFGSIHTESLDPVFQYDAVYGINGN